MDFAKRQLTKQGWTDGSGLGKEEAGIKEPVKVKIKNDTKGVGHDSGAEFTFHWWDHLFNKAAGNIDVKHTEAGVEIKNSTATERSKKKTRTYDNKAMLYGQFVKGATLNGGTETSEQLIPAEEQGEAQIKHALLPDNEEEVFKKCGGRTAHKGARHGLKLNGKLQRIEYQEQLLLDKLTGKSTNHGQGQSSGPDLTQSEQTSTDCLASDKNVSDHRKEQKKLKRKHSPDTDVIKSEEITVDSVELNDRVKKDKKEKRKNQSIGEASEVKKNNNIDASDDVSSEMIVKKKKKRKNKSKEEESEDKKDNDIDASDDVSSKMKVKKKKKRKNKSKEEESEDKKDNDIDASDDVSLEMKGKKKKKKKRKHECDELETENVENA